VESGQIKDLSSNSYGNTPFGGLSLDNGFNPFNFKSNNIQVISLSGFFKNYQAKLILY
jgi:hypothetical protein